LRTTDINHYFALSRTQVAMLIVVYITTA